MPLEEGREVVSGQSGSVRSASQQQVVVVLWVLPVERELSIVASGPLVPKGVSVEVVVRGVEVRPALLVELLALQEAVLAWALVWVSALPFFQPVS